MFPATTTILGDTSHACLGPSGFQSAGSCGNAYISFPQDPSGAYYLYSGAGTDYGVYANLEGSVNDLSGQVAVTANKSLYATNIVGWWKFDEGTGIVAKDFSGYGTDLSFLNTPSLISWQAGKSGSSIKFDSSIPVTCVTGTVVQSSSVSDKIKNLASGDFTVNQWIRDFTGTGFFHSVRIFYRDMGI